MGSAELLSGYRYQSLPDLSGKRDPVHSRLSLTRATHIQLHEEFRRSNIGLQSIIRAAFAKVLLGYIESSEFLFADIGSGSANQASLKLLRVSLSDCDCWVAFVQRIEQQASADVSISLDTARRILGLPFEVNPLPARFVSGSFEDLISTYSDGLLLLGIHGPQTSGNPPSSSQDEESVELSVVCDGRIMSEHALQNYVEQACATALHISTNPAMSPLSTIPLPNHLKSAYEEDYDPSRALIAVDWLTLNAATRPNAIAHEIYNTLEEPPVLLSYAELNSRSNMLANWFIKNGVCLEDKVAVCRTRDVHFYIANAAIFKCGACYVSIDPELPLERRQFIVRDSGARFVVTTAALASDFGDIALVPENESTAKAMSRQPSGNICLAQLDSLAYLLYTSGTTGTPKGCLLNHRGLYWAIDAMCAYPKPVTNPDTDKRLALASIAFDVHISEICQTWCLGIRLVSAPRYEILADLQGNLITLGITHAGMVPSMIEATLSGPDDLPLKYLVSGGEKISDSLLRKWANHPSLILANFYGPTEATIGCTSRLIRQTDRKENIGHPFPSCRAYVVDTSMNIVPRGNPGELVVEGPLVGRGYHNLPEATAKAFKKWPTPDSNTYCTGDLVRMMPDDTIEIMGRIDTQIKLRGVRIESEGVSNVLRKASERPLDVATLIAKHPDSGSELLVSFVALGDRQISVAERRSGHVELAQDFPMTLMESLKSMAARELAVYMRPSHIVPIVSLPLSLNMKTDTKLLAEFFRVTPLSTLLAVQRERNIAELPLSPQKTGPLDADQSSVAEIVSRLCNIPFAQIRADSNILEYGMDSLKLSVLARELRKLWTGSQIVVAGILVAPVLSSIAKLKKARSDGSMEPDLLREFNQTWRVAAESIFRPEDIESVLPTFPVQEGVLFQAMVSPTQYVQHFIYRVKEHIQGADLHRAWAAMIYQHPILRTAFLIEDTPLQVLLRPEAVQIPLATHHQPLRQKSLSFSSWFLESEKDCISAEINGDFTIPAFRVNIYELKDRFMVVSLSHAIYDGVALPSLMKSLDVAIVRHDTSEVVPLQPLLESIQTSQEYAREFWSEKLSRLDLKHLSPRRPVKSQAQYTRREFKTISFEEMQAACRAQHTTFQALGCASYALAGRDTLGWRGNAIFGIIRSGRSLPVDGVETAVVPLVSLVPFVFTDLGTSTHDALIKSQVELASTLAFEHTPLGSIQRWLGFQLLFETLFSCRIEEDRSPYTSFEHCEAKAPLTEFILSVELLANPSANTIEAKAAFTEELHIRQVESLLSNVERHFWLLARGESIPSPNGEATETTQQDALGANSNKSQRTGGKRDELVEALTPVVASFLNAELDLITSNTSLVSLGLTSLKAVALSRKLKDVGISISPIDIIQADTIDQLALKCESSDGRVQPGVNPEHTQWLDTLHQELADKLDMTSLKLSEDDKLLVTGATTLQAGMLSQTVSSEDRLYVHGFTFKLRPDCSLEKLKSSWRQTIKDISTLRTSFIFSENTGRWAQVVHSEFEFPWISSEFKELSRAPSEFISDLPLTDVHDFKRPPLYLCHFKTGDCDYLLVVLHHALYDGVSLPLLFHRVQSIYHGIAPPSPISFHDLIPQILIQENFGSSYWIDKLAGASVSTFPRAPNSSSFGAWRGSAECQIELAEIQRTCRRYQVNVQCFGQAAMAGALSQLLEKNNVIFGQVVSGRTLAGAEEVIGPVFNTIPCHIDLSSYRTYGDLLRGIQRANIEGLPYQHASLRSIQRGLGVKTLIDALFLFQPDVSAKSTNLHPIWDLLERIDKDETKTQYGLNIELHQNPSGFTIRGSCSAAVMDQAKLRELLSNFSMMLHRIATCPSTLIDTQRNIDVISARPNHGPKITTPRVVQTTPGIAYTSDFAGWSDTQMKFRDLLVAFTRIPASNIQPSSQLASLGLDSISSIQLTSMAKRAGIRLSAADVARSTTLADIATIIARNSESLEETPNKKPVPHPSRPLLDDQIIAQARQALAASLQHAVELFTPATPGMNFILSSWVRSGGWRFQHAFTFKVAPSVDSSRLHHAWDKLVERHAILRSIFVPLGDQNVLCVLKPGSIRTPWNEVITDGSIDDLEEVGRITRQTVGNPPLLRNGPAARITYMRGKGGDYVVLEMHHALYDAWSFNMILQDWEDLYLGNAVPDRNDLGHLVNVIASQEKAPEQRTYWETAFHGFRPSLVELHTTTQPHRSFGLAAAGELVKHAPIPLLFSLGTFQTVIATRPRLSRTARLITGAFAAAGACLSTLTLARRSGPGIPVSRTCCVFRDLLFGFTTLNRLSMEWGLPLHMVLLACWARIQARRSSSGEQGIVFGLLHSGRGLDGTDDIAAPCINVLPVYVRNPLQENAFVVAQSLQADLKSRSAVVQQSRLQDIGTWIGASGKPLFHYFVNMLKVPSMSGQNKASTGILERIKVTNNPVATRSIEPNTFRRSLNPVFEAMQEVQDDCMIEIFFDTKRDSIGMEVTCKSTVLNPDQAQELASEWGNEVLNAFRSQSIVGFDV